MKTIGVIGGIGPESTVAYHRPMVAAYRRYRPDGSYPSIIINSIDMRKHLCSGFYCRRFQILLEENGAEK